MSEAPISLEGIGGTLRAIRSELGTIRKETADYRLRWMVLFGCYIVALIWIYASKSNVAWSSVWPVAKPVAVLLLMTGLLGMVASGTAKLSKLQYVALLMQDVTGSMAQLLATGALMALLIHIAACLGAAYPLQDETLTRIDASMGFSWEIFVSHLSAYPAVMNVLASVYTTSLAQACIVMLLGSILRLGSYNRELFWIVAIGSLLTVIIFLFVPAVGKLGRWDSDVIARLMELRAGGVTMTYDQTFSMIWFPSFHTFTAAVVVYMSRYSPWCFVPALLVNVVMLVAIPPIGGHYLIDVIAGLGVAAVSITIFRVCFTNSVCATVRVGRMHSAA